MGEIIKRYKSMSQTAKAGIWFVICSCIQSGIKFIALPIFANIMSVEDYGTVTMYTSWFSIVFIFATLALGRANGVFYVAMVKYPDDRDLFTTAMEGLTIFLCSISFLLSYISIELFGDWMRIGITQYPAMFLELTGYGVMLLWSLRMRYDYSYRPLLLVTITYSLSTIIIPMICVLNCPNSISPAAMKNWSGAIAAFTIGIILFVLSIKKNKKVFDWNYWKFAFKFNVPLIPHYLSNVILVQSDRIMIAEIINEAAAAIYNVAYTLGVAAQVITQALINAINPWMYQKMKENQGNEVRKTIYPLLILVSVLILGLCLIMPEAFNLVFPSAYADALEVVPPVAAGVLWAFIFNLYASIELYFSGNKLVSISSVIGAAINIFTNLLLIPIFGFIVAAYTTLLSDVIYAGLHSFFSHRLLRKNMPGVDVIPIAPVWIIGIVSTLLCFVILLLYPFPYIRYALCAIGIIILIFKRKHVVRVMKFREGRKI